MLDSTGLCGIPLVIRRAQLKFSFFLGGGGRAGLKVWCSSLGRVLGKYSFLNEPISLSADRVLSGVIVTHPLWSSTTPLYLYWPPSRERQAVYYHWVEVKIGQFRVPVALISVRQVSIWRAILAHVLFSVSTALQLCAELRIGPRGSPTKHDLE